MSFIPPSIFHQNSYQNTPENNLPKGAEVNSPFLRLTDEQQITASKLLQLQTKHLQANSLTFKSSASEKKKINSVCLKPSFPDQQSYTEEFSSIKTLNNLILNKNNNNFRSLSEAKKDEKINLEYKKDKTSEGSDCFPDNRKFSYNFAMNKLSSFSSHGPQRNKYKKSYNFNSSLNSDIPITSEYILTDGKKCFQCPQCRYATDRKNNLKRHLGTMHRDCGRLLRCCDLVFNSKAAMREHIFSVHKSGYRCQRCGKSFCRKALLKRHEAGHEDCLGFVHETSLSVKNEPCKIFNKNEVNEQKIVEVKDQSDFASKTLVLEKAVVQNEAFVIRKVPNVNYIEKNKIMLEKNIADSTADSKLKFGKPSDYAFKKTEFNTYDNASNIDFFTFQMNQLKLMEFYRRLHYNRLCYDSLLYADYFKLFSEYSNFKKLNEKYPNNTLQKDDTKTSLFMKNSNPFQSQHFLSLNECFINLQKKFLLNEKTYQNIYLQQKFSENLKKN